MQFLCSQACSDSKSRPGFLTDKALDPAIKAIVKKFPVTDPKVIESWTLQFFENKIENQHFWKSNGMHVVHGHQGNLHIIIVHDNICRAPKK